VAFVEIGKGFTEVVRVDVGEYLPEYLAVFKLVVGGDSTGELE
jgi:hypothetical protein